MDETTLVSGGDASAKESGRRQIAVGPHGHVHRMVDRLRNEDAVQRHDDAVVVFDVGGKVIVPRVGLMVVILEVRVRDQMLSVRPFGAVHVLHRRQRKRGQSGDEAQ